MGASKVCYLQASSNRFFTLPTSLHLVLEVGFIILTKVSLKNIVYVAVTFLFIKSCQFSARMWLMVHMSKTSNLATQSKNTFVVCHTVIHTYIHTLCAFYYLLSLTTLLCNYFPIWNDQSMNRLHITSSHLANVQKEKWGRLQL